MSYRLQSLSEERAAAVCQEQPQGLRMQVSKETVERGKQIEGPATEAAAPLLYTLTRTPPPTCTLLQSHGLLACCVCWLQAHEHRAQQHEAGDSQLWQSGIG